MTHQLSILLPTFNDSCSGIVSQLSHQALNIPDLSYEILIGDDGSTNQAIIDENQQLTRLPHCKVYRFEKNRGRAAIRNSLTDFAEKEWLLFVDSGDMLIQSDHYIQRYLLSTDGHQVVYGGYTLSHLTPDLQTSNLRYKYEMASLHNSSATMRKKMRIPNFQSSNFMARRDICQQVRFDERCVRYGHEDTLWAKDLSLHGITIHHIDNPIQRYKYEDNTTYLAKTIESLTTLHQFHDELSDYSRLIRIAQRIDKFHLTPLVRYIFRHNEQAWIANLQGNNPSLRVFNLFRLGYYIASTNPPSQD